MDWGEPMKAILVSLLVSLVVFKSEAKSLGIIGSVFPVMEMSFLTGSSNMSAPLS